MNIVTLLVRRRTIEKTEGFFDRTLYRVNACFCRDGALLQ